MSHRAQLALIIILFVLSLLIALPQSLFPRPDLNLSFGPVKLHRSFDLKLGLDLAGGVHLVLEADMDQIAPEDKDAALQSAAEVIRRRVDLFGVSEANVQTATTTDSYRIIAELPGLTNTNDAIALIGQTAQLSFREPVKDASPSALALTDFRPTDLTGKDLKKASVQFDNTSGQPVVALQFNPDGQKKFADLTSKHINQPLAIFLDQLPLTIPIVQQEITDGNAIISGSFTIDQAKQLAVQLNAGALPVPINIIQQRNIGATLGQASIEKSLQAGLIGLIVVALFMIGLYGSLGLIAVLALTIYASLTLAVYKLIPITLSLPGLAGFILSVGMAVDSNILIFERFKEERRDSLSWQVAIERAFGRAWDSIKDANIATLTTTFILLNPFDWPFLPTSGLVRGFAVTLGLGILLSLFTGVVVSRTLIRVFYRERN